MNLNELHDKLITVARANVISDKVPYAFEKRVAALLASRVAPHRLDAWVHGLWRAAVSCVAVALLCGAWAILTPASSSGADDLSQNFENTLLASIDQNQNDSTP